MRSPVIGRIVLTLILLSAATPGVTGRQSQPGNRPRAQGVPEREPRISGLYSNEIYDSRSGDTAGVIVFIVADFEGRKSRLDAYRQALVDRDTSGVHYSALVQFLDGSPPARAPDEAELFDGTVTGRTGRRFSWDRPRLYVTR